MGARAWDEWDELLDQLVRGEDDVVRAVSPRLLELQGQSPVGQLVPAARGEVSWQAASEGA